MGNRDMEWNLDPYFGRNSEVPDLNLDDGDKKEQIADRQANRGHRNSLVFWVKIIVSLWLFTTVAILSFCGLRWMFLSDAVLVTLLATTTVNILGLAAIVLRGLFK